MLSENVRPAGPESGAAPLELCATSGMPQGAGTRIVPANAVCMESRLVILDSERYPPVGSPPEFASWVATALDAPLYWQRRTRSNM